MFWRLPGKVLVILTVVMAVSVTVHPESRIHADELTFSCDLAAKGHVLIASEGATKPSVELKWAKPRLLPFISFQSVPIPPTPAPFVFRRTARSFSSPFAPRLVGTVELRL